MLSIMQARKNEPTIVQVRAGYALGSPEGLARWNK